ncbi:MAG: peptidylprolyl isomerase [Candidatus Omnitrophota bacterium]
MFKKRIYFIFILIISLLISNSPKLEAQTYNKIVAIVNEEVITQQDIDQLLGVLYAQYVHTYQGEELLEKMEEIKKDILNQMIEDRLILSRAKELGVTVTEEEMEERLSEIKNGFPTEEFFYNTLETQGITISDLKSRYRDQILMKKIVNYEIKSKVSVLPSEINDFYTKNKPQFKQDIKYRVRHILIKAEDEVGFELAKVEMREIYNKVVAGNHFDSLARTYSQGPNKEQGGDMGYIGKGEMLEELEDVIFSLKKGEISEPIRSKIGYHIFKVEDIKKAGYLPLEEVQNDIKQLLFQEKLAKSVKEWLGELRKKAYISIKE